VGVVSGARLRLTETDGSRVSFLASQVAGPQPPKVAKSTARGARH
jgi:hypothetical protein